MVQRYKLHAMMSGILTGFLLSMNDVFSFGLAKSLSLSGAASRMGLLLPALMYSLQIPLFYIGLKSTTMTVLNITWNLFSNILVTGVGLFYFAEKVSGIKALALLFAFTSIGLFAYEPFAAK